MGVVPTTSSPGAPHASLGAGLTIAEPHAGPGSRLGATGPESRERKSGDLKAFLQMNPEEGFDLEALNSTDLRALVEEVQGKKWIARQVMRKVDSLLPRVRSETEDVALVGAILRNKTLDWYRHSPSDNNWAERMPLRWGGMFHETRVPGGRLSPQLTARLARLHMECAKASGVGGRIGGLLRRLTKVGKTLRKLANSLFELTNLKTLHRGSKRVRPPPELPMPQVAQAYLDGLAANARADDRPFGLERLSELARRIGLVEVNRTLGELFPRDGGGPVIVLDARYHPDAQTVMVTSPAHTARRDAVVYDLVHANATSLRESAAPDAATTEATLGSPWEREMITSDDWKALLEGLQSRKAKLEPPPLENHRSRDSYLRLRELILADSAACKSFVAVHWKGKPTGLPLLARLLSEGTFIPEAETDGDYLEAELGHIEKGNPDSRPKDGRWRIGRGWKVTRKIAEGNVRTYRADGRALD